ncbi:hypothetical protein [Rathayibacter sp. VKM Ac-2630]|uniref:hypothetical protein n=1 Tax=Rathayibacter sp. VKM Ac-2630 TaxID=1938617 RepID=UPI000980E8DA|nr:hypothetical protein [Rathayibacter sp. VKM Ac-2630]OOB90750.1 hypothetical protein B0T42_10105 [Rathayibacter sp. VKM Ac-2630]
MSDIITFTIGGVEVHGRPDGLAPPDGIYLGPGGADAWWESAEMERDVVKRPGAPGAFDTPGQLGDKLLPFSGVIITPSEEETEELSRKVRGLIADGSLTTVTDGTWMMRGRLSGRSRAVPRRGNRRFADWIVTVWCPDPRKYGETKHFTAGERASHRGNFTALPVYTVSGNAPAGYPLYGPGGRRYDVVQPLKLGTPHVIDMRDGLLRIDGAVVPGAATRADTWGIPAGAQIVHSIGPGLTLDVALTDTDI